MPTCKRMTELATDRAEGHLGLFARLAFDRHLARCDGCAAYVRQLETTRRAVGLLPEPEVSPALQDALLAQFDAWAAHRRAAPAAAPEPAARLALAPTVTVAATLALLLAFARSRSFSPDDWVIGVALAASALGMAAMAGRFALGVAGAAVAGAAAAAMAGGGAGALDAASGVHCLAIELGAAAVAGGASFVGRRARSPLLRRRSLAGSALAGALAADAALQLTCRAHEALPHLAVFHFGGVVLVAAGAWLLLRATPLPAAGR